MIVIKRNGQEDQYSKGKIHSAIDKAVNDVRHDDGNNTLADTITNRLDSRYRKRKRAISVEEIQDDVETELMKEQAYDVAKAYIRYRHEHELMRNGGVIDGKILTIVDGVNEEVIQENSNKNPTILSTQRDYIAGEVSKDISNRLLIPDEIRKAHEEGIIHFHDSDYFVQRMHNCFSSKTEFVTQNGVTSFAKCRDGQKVTVLDKDGMWREATVRNYGKRKLYDVHLRSCRSEVTVTCTRDHRWILKDGSVTTDLMVGDALYLLHDTSVPNAEMDDRDAEMFALGFIIGDGADYSCGISARLCGHKTGYAPIFERCGFTVNALPGTGDVRVQRACNLSKQEFLDAKAWRYLSSSDKESIFRGLYAADGSVDSNRMSTSDERVLMMICEISAIAGYHVSSVKTELRDTNYKEDAILHTVHFRTHQNVNNPWVVDAIEPHHRGTLEQDVWCVEEPITHSFTLNGGIVTGNCCLVNLEDMLQNGTVISGTMIEKPHSFSTACNIATQIIAQVASCQYGGQSISLTHLAPFVDVSRQKIKAQVLEEYVEFTGHEPQDETDYDEYMEIVERRLREEIKRGVQTIQYQVVTLMTTNGQAPFITVFMYLGEAQDEQTKNDLAMIIEEVVTQRYEGVKNEKGAWITPAFPKLIYVLEEDNITEDSKYWYLTELCAKCSAKRLVPDYISEKMMLQNKIDKNGDGHCYTCMGCRSFLTPYLDENGKPKYYGRFNQGVVTINLPDVGLSAHGDMDLFWKIFEERLELCHRALRLRHERLLGTLSDASPIHWQNGALARLQKGEKIDKLLYGGYSTLSLGYAGLYECVKAMTGKSHTDDEAKPFALAIMQKMNDKCKEWKEAENIDYSLYGTPIESTTYKFAKALQKRFGIIEGITDKNYITNSYHVHVTEKINAFDKLRFEAEFQLLSPGGAISYIETANLNDNIEAVLAVIKYIYDHIMYAELNTKSDFCQVCGYDGEISIVENEDGKLVWECPNCGNRNKSKMNVARRTCGL